MGRLRYPSQSVQLTSVEIEELLDELEGLNREYNEVMREINALISEGKQAEEKERALKIVREAEDKLEDAKEMYKRINEIRALLNRAGILTVGQLTRQIKTISV